MGYLEKLRRQRQNPTPDAREGGTSENGARDERTGSSCAKSAKSAKSPPSEPGPPFGTFGTSVPGHSGENSAGGESPAVSDHRAEVESETREDPETGIDAGAKSAKSPGLIPPTCRHYDGPTPPCPKCGGPTHDAADHLPGIVVLLCDDDERCRWALARSTREFARYMETGIVPGTPADRAS